MKRVNTWTTYDAKTEKEAEKFAASYKSFLDNGKTERECVELIVNEIEKEGFKDLRTLTGKRGKLKAGDKVYAVWMNKTIVMFRLGKEPMEHGMNILGAHLDSPRCDVKGNPLYDDTEIAYLDTHYYGGIKKYLYVTIPLALHGVVVRKDGTTAVLNIGEDEDDPVFFFSDLLIHLSQEQMEKKASKVVEAEALDLIVGSKPFIVETNDTYKGVKTAGLTAGGKYAATAMQEERRTHNELSGSVKRGILALLKDMYNIEEEDFLSAELEIVPAGKARDAGLDRSMILSYGQDDRVCSYPSYRALTQAKTLKRTGCCILVDKEEIGSVGATGMQSKFFENTVAEVLALMGETGDLTLRRCLANSAMLSSDVTSAFDPKYASAYEKKNAALLGYGMAFNKFTGARGKVNSNDANAEYIAAVRNIFAKRKINYQFGELGKVDLGGGGTIAYILALYGMNVIDAGVPVLNMHAPYEATSKADIYEMYRGYLAFLEEMEFRNV